MLLLSVVLAASPLGDASRQYGDLEYEACVTTLSNPRAIAPKERAAAELLLGLCHFALGHEARARAAIESSFRRDPSARPPGSASPKELEFIETVRATASPDPARTKKPPTKREPEVKVAETRPAEVPAEKPPEVTPPVTEPPPPAEPKPPEKTPLAELVPPPPPPPSLTAPAEPKATWLPWLAAGVAVAGAGTGTGLGLNARALETRGNAEPIQLEAARLRNDAQLNATGANVAFAVAATAAAATVITFILTR